MTETNKIDKKNFKLALISLDNNHNPHIGLVSIASYLEKKLGIENIRIIDNNFDDVINDTINYAPDLIGISAFTITYGRAEKIAAELKQKLNCPVIVGGPHISTLPASLNKVFDFGVLNEGEMTLVDCIEKFLAHGKFSAEVLSSINGICFHDGNKFVATPAREFVNNLDEFLPLNKKYFNPLFFEKKRIVALNDLPGVAVNFITSRGCPYNCTFCSTTRFWKKVRFNSISKVVDELQDFYENLKVNHFDIVDDLFSINKARLAELRDELERRNLLGKFTIMCQLRANLVDEELCLLLKSLNVKSVGFGFESGSEKILKYLKGCSVTVKQNKNAIELCKSHGFIVSGSLILGSPQETVEDFKETINFIDFCISKKVDSLAAYIMTPFPATPIWDIAKSMGKVTDDMDWSLLSHANLDKQIYINDAMDYATFKELFLIVRKKLQYYKWRAIMNNLRNAPVYLLKAVFEDPAKSVRILFGHKTHS